MHTSFCQIQGLSLLLGDWLVLLVWPESCCCFGSQLIQSTLVCISPLYHLEGIV